MTITSNNAAFINKVGYFWRIASMAHTGLVRIRIRSFMLNFGPQHPAAHGILRISFALSGEVLVRADLQFGLLHRGSEKLCESRTFLQAIPYLDRMDYVANLIQEHSVIQSIEALWLKRRASVIVRGLRTICDELSRVLNHLLTMSALCLDLGAMGPIFWAFEERELIMEVFERISGARMHTAMHRPFSIGGEFQWSYFNSDVIAASQRGSRVIGGAFLGLSNSRSLRSRFSHIGSFSVPKLNHYGIHGVLLRASGNPYDLRTQENITSNYGLYSSLALRSFIGKRGDCYDRFMLRVREIVESYRVSLQVINLVPLGFLSSIKSLSLDITRSKFVSMEGVISHFKSQFFNFSSVRGMSFSTLESPKGSIGVLIVSSGSHNPYRLHVRSPVAHNLFLLHTPSTMYTLADFVSTFCSLDVVLGEIDR